jgi:hypothetical protein
MDVNEISRMIAIEKPRIISLLGKRVLASHVRRRLENEYDRALLEFLNLYANRLRRWMEQTLTRCATRLLHLPICTARTLKLLSPLQLRPIRQALKTIFGFYTNGTRPTRGL